MPFGVTNGEHIAKHTYIKQEHIKTSFEGLTWQLQSCIYRQHIPND